MTISRLRIDQLAFTWAKAPLQIGVLGVFDGGPFLGDDGAVDLDAAARELAARAAALPQLRRRVLWTHPGEGRPLWVADPAFDPRGHVTVAAAPIRSELASWAATEAAWPLDRERPLWRAVVVGPLPQQRFAVLVVVSHILADGLAGVSLLSALFDPRPETATPPPADGAVPPLPTHRELLAGRLREILAPLQSGRRPRRGGVGWRQQRAAMADLAGPEPPTSLPRRVGCGRRLGVVPESLAEVERTGHALGATVNDLVLAAVTTGLRDLLTARGENAPDLVLRTTVPAATGRTGRQVMAMLVVPLPVGEPDPLRRLELIRRSTIEGKRRLRAAGGDVTDVRLPVPLARLVFETGRRVGSRHLTLAVSDVPGPRSPLWLAGARLLEAIPIAPVSPPVPLAVAALSYAGRLVVTINAGAAVDDLGVLEAGTARGFTELGRLDGNGSGSGTLDGDVGQLPGEQGAVQADVSPARLGG